MAVRRLQNSEDCRRYLAWLIREVENGRIASGKARDLGYLTGHLLKSIEISEVDKRLNEIEALLMRGAA